MNLSFNPEEIAFRDEVRAFFKAALPRDIQRRAYRGQFLQKSDYVTWHRILTDKGWVAPEWTPEWGGTGWTAAQLYIFAEEMHRAYAPQQRSQNINLAGNTLVAFGTEEQKKHFLPKIANMDLFFCQGFSEPGAGSDLASLKTRAENKGDHYLINGQKIWTSGAHLSNWMFGLFRTDPNARKQKGITYLLVDMTTPGITVRPIVSIDGAHHLNEVFFDNVQVPIANRIGDENRGWDYAKHLMGNARATVARVGLSKARIAKAKALAASVTEDGKPLSENARFREKLAAIEVELKALEITNMRAIAGKRQDGRQDPKSSVLKMKGSELQQTTTEILLDVAGPHAMARQTDFYECRTEEAIGPETFATTAHSYYMARAVSIFSGTNEVQRNIVAKAILGL
jgi:alkylation response protein AidB-like acyl-CoA dehydrogenase